jgi:hypothetical protein
LTGTHRESKEYQIEKRERHLKRGNYETTVRSSTEKTENRTKPKRRDGTTTLCTKSRTLNRVYVVRGRHNHTVNGAYVDRLVTTNQKLEIKKDLNVKRGYVNNRPYLLVREKETRDRKRDEANKEDTLTLPYVCPP